MTDKNRSGWLSSVVGNISGFWTRSPTENDKSAHNSFTEVQSDSDFEGADRFEDAVSKFSPDKPTTSSNGVNAKSRSARYLSPTLLMNSVHSSRDGSDETRATVSRKRTFEDLTDGESKGLSNGRLARLDLSVDASYLNGNSPKRTRSSNRFLNETAPQLDRSLLDRSVDPRTPVPNFEFSSKSSLLQPRISRPPSATSSTLTSKTRAILQQLEKISTPVKEVKKMPFMCRSERWSTDIRTPVSRTLSSSSPRSLSRAQIISNTMSASVPHKPYWRRPERQDMSFEASRKNDLSSLPAENSILDSVHPTVANNGKTSQYIFAKDTSLTSRKKVEPVLKGVEGRIPKAAPKTFSAKALDLEVDTNENENNLMPVEESLFSAKGLTTKALPPAPGFLDGTASTGNAKLKVPDVSAKTVTQESLGDDLFSFSLPKKRGPCPLEEEEEEVEEEEEEEDEESSVDRSGPEEEEDELEDSEKDESKEEKPASRKGIEHITEKKIVPIPTIAFGKPSEKSGIAKVDNAPATKVRANSEAKPSETTDKTPADKNSLFTSEPPATLAVEPEKRMSTEKPSKPACEKWTCASCWVKNENAVTKCVCCGNPAPQAAPAPLTATSAPAAPSSKPWTCPECYVPNKADVVKCPCCGYENKASSAEKAEPGKPLFGAAASNAPNASQASSANVFGNRAFKPVSAPSTGASFGFGLQTNAASSDSEASLKPVLSTSNSTASFGLGIEASAAPKFGLNSSSSAPNFGLLFKKSTEAPSSLATIPEEKVAAPVMPLFGNSAPTKVPAVETSRDAKLNSTSEAGSKGVFSFKGPMFGAAAGTSASTSEAPTFGTVKATPSTGTTFPPVFGSLGTSLTKPASSEAETSATKPTLAFGTKPLAFGAAVSDTTGGTAKPLTIPSSLPTTAKEDSSSSVEMASPTSNGVSAVSQAPSNNAFSFSAAQPSFNFLSNSATAPTSTTSGLFGPISSAGSTNAGSTFSFGSAAVEPAKSFSDSAATTNPPSTLTKAFSTPSVPLPPSSFNFGGSATNPPNLFGGISQAPTSNFQFGAATAENPFGVHAGPFSGSNAPPNFFTSGTTTTTARKLLKARRTRK